MILKTMNDLIPEEIKNKIILKSIEAIGYFRKAHKIKSAFSIYLESSYSRLSLMKTLLYRNEPIKLSECYVRNSVTFIDNDNHNNIIEDYELLNFILNRKRVIISGSAGVGKSVLCKSIFLEMVNKANGIYPIFLELRELKHYPQFSLLEYICSEISNVECKINSSNLEQLIRNGNILLIFDGFDELDFDIRNSYTNQILTLSKKYSRINILISSRPDDDLKSWSGFCEVSVNSLDKMKAIELISKLRYEENIKKQFIKKIDDELYDSHTSFIGNPLLLTMMLMTFQEFAEIPKKIYLFYEQAFQTLFLKHDSLKELYIRKTRSNIDINEFKKVFSYFCLLTHIRKKIVFSESEAGDFILRGLKHFDKDIEPKNFLSDLMNNLCVIHRDGLNLTFTHRSFQEYFSALYLKDCQYIDKLYELIDKSIKINSNNIAEILYDMNPELMENRWIIPKIELLINESIEIDKKLREDKVKSIIKSIFITKLTKGSSKLSFFFVQKDFESGYNYIEFNRFIWNTFRNQIRFNQSDIYSLVPAAAPLSNKIESIFNDIISGDECHEWLFSLDEIKSKLNYIDYYYLIDYLYNIIISNRKSVLIKIRDNIKTKNISNDLDIEKLLSL